MNAVIENIINRRSIRSFLKDQITDEELSMILEAAIYAPTGYNHQPWHFTVVQDRQLIDFINFTAKKEMSCSSIEKYKKLGANPKVDLTYGAPTVIFVSGKKDAYSPLTDCSAAIQNMLLAAKSLNIGSLWLGLIDHAFKDSTVLEKLQIPNNYQPYYGICFGYIDESKSIILPKRKEDVVTYIR